MTFVLADGDRHEVNAKVGENLLDVIIDNDVDIDGFGKSNFILSFPFTI